MFLLYFVPACPAYCMVCQPMRAASTLGHQRTSPDAFVGLILSGSFGQDVTGKRPLRPRKDTIEADTAARKRGSPGRYSYLWLRSHHSITYPFYVCTTARPLSPKCPSRWSPYTKALTQPASPASQSSQPAIFSLLYLMSTYQGRTGGAFKPITPNPQCWGHDHQRAARDLAPVSKSRPAQSQSRNVRLLCLTGLTKNDTLSPPCP